MQNTLTPGNDPGENETEIGPMVTMPSTNGNKVFQTGEPLRPTVSPTTSFAASAAGALGVAPNSKTSEAMGSPSDSLRYNSLPETPPQPGRKWPKILGISAAVLIVLAVGGYFAYAKYVMPTQVWNGFVQTLKSNQSETGPLHVQADITANNTIDGKNISGNGSFIVDIADVSKKGTDADVHLTANSITDGQNQTFKAEAREIGGITYLNLDLNGIPNIQEILSGMGFDSSTWFKLDLNKLPPSVSSFVTSQTKILDGSANPLADALNDGLISAHTYLGTDKINGQNALHYSMVINKEVIKKEIDKTLDQAAAAGTATTETAQQVTDSKNSMHTFIDSLDINKSEVWLSNSGNTLTKIEFAIAVPTPVTSIIGTADSAASNNAKTQIDIVLAISKPAQAVVVIAPDKSIDILSELGALMGGFSTPATAMPGLSGCSQDGINCPAGTTGTDTNQSGALYQLSGLDAARAKARDALRLADIRNLQVNLELYYNDNSKYPAADAKGYPVGLAPTYLQALPSAPIPADGACTTQQNYYIYKAASNGKTYTMTFCLGASTGGFAPGMHTASPTGIQ